MTTLADVYALDGMLGEEEVELLYQRAKASQHPIVEIGSYRGKSTCALALGSRDGQGVPVYAIDPHQPTADGYPYGAQDRAMMLKNIVACEVADLVRVWDMPSTHTPQCLVPDVGLLWVDGDHHNVQNDVSYWIANVIGGGWVLLHDRHLSLIEATATWLRQRFDIQRLENVGGIIQLRFDE